MGGIARSILSLGIPLFIGTAIVLIDLYLPRLFQTLKHAQYDFAYEHFRVEPKVDSRLVYFMVDDATVEQLNKIPIPRSTHSSLLEGLKSVDIDLVIWDYIFDTTTDDDEEFIRSIARVPSLLALGARYDHTQGHSERALERIPDRVNVGDPLDNSPGYAPRIALTVQSRQEFLDGSRGAGHVIMSVDSDGRFRRVPIVGLIDDRRIPALGLAAAMEILQINPGDIKFDPEHAIYLGDTRIPLDQNGNLLINFVSDWRSRFDNRSYVGQLESLKLAPDFLKEGLTGKSVLIGPTESGSGDFVSTTLESSIPGSLITLNVINTILTESFIYSTKTSHANILVILIPILFGILFRFCGPIASALTTAVVLGCLTILPLYFMHSLSIFFPTVTCIVASLLALGFLLTMSHVTEYRQALYWSSLLSRFVSPTLINELDSSSRFKVRRKEVTVLFVDVAGFTPFTETSEPEEVSEFLNEFYSSAMEVLEIFEGTLDKFQGDGVLAYFGAPADDSDKEVHASLAAIELRSRFRKAETDRLRRGATGLSVRCGLATGYVAVGYFGGARFASYGIIGRSVNLASRLQGAADNYEILMDRSTAARLPGEFDVKRLPDIQLKGIVEPVETWKLTGVSSPVGRPNAENWEPQGPS